MNVPVEERTGRRTRGLQTGPFSVTAVPEAYRNLEQISGAFAKQMAHSRINFPMPPRVWRWPGVRVPLPFSDLGATGANSIAFYLLPHFMRETSTLRAVPADLIDTLEETDALEDLPEGWNGHDVAAPKLESIQRAAEWIERFHEDIVRNRFTWRKPHVAADENGEVTFEWSRGEAGLTFYIPAGDDEVGYLKDWGPDVVDDMEDGVTSTSEERLELWAWFEQQ